MTQSFKNETDDLPMPIYKGNRFINPFDYNDGGFGALLKWQLTCKNHTNLPRDKKELDRTLPVHQVTDEEINAFCKMDTEDKIRVLWVGHSSCIVNMENCVLLVDPLFSERCSFSQKIGPKRFRPVPIKIENIPKCDAVVISHNHYDHLDYESIKELHKKIQFKYKLVLWLKNG